MKKILQTILIIVLVLLLSGCGELSLRVEKPNSGGSAGGNANGSDLSDSEALKNDPDAFTVTIRYEGKQYKPKKKDEMKARWTDGYSVFIADFADDGVARVAGLDGDYRVTLEGLPSGYVYDPNAYTATNDQRQIIIDIYKPIKVSGLGPHEFNCIEIRKTGVYRVELKSASQKVFFEYAPETSGTYSVESWVSTSDSQYNPKVDVYTGTIAYKQYAYTLDDGGYCKGYTKNFKHIVEIADEQISGSGGGQVVFTFAVHIDSKNSVYPVYLDFAVKLNGGFSLGYGDHEMIIPTESFEYTPEYSPSEYYWKWAETDTQGVEGRYEFDGKMFKLFEKDEDIDGDGIGDGDGYYHLYDEATNTYGAILYAKINQACRFLDLDFTHIEDPGNKSLTVNRTENHKLFIQGLSALLVDQPGDAGMYFCLPECPCLKKHTCTEKCEFPCENAATCFGACPESCLKCDPDCRRLPDWVFDVTYYCHPQCECRQGAAHGFCDYSCDKCNEFCKTLPKELADAYYANGYSFEGTGYRVFNTPAIGNILAPIGLAGYASYTNSDGVYAVTEELKHFLQSFSISQRMFADGNGWVEENPTVKVDAREEDQWLFACGYHEKR